jgi:hypothetical protein
VSLPTAAWFGPDAPDKLLVHTVYEGVKWPASVVMAAVNGAAELFGPTGRVCFTTGRRPPRKPAGYAHATVVEELGWYALPGGGRAEGLTPFDMRYAAQTAWDVRGCWLDERVSERRLRDNLIHELFHVAGLTHEQMERPDRLALAAQGFAACAAAALSWRLG